MQQCNIFCWWVFQVIMLPVEHMQQCLIIAWIFTLSALYFLLDVQRCWGCLGVVHPSFCWDSYICDKWFDRNIHSVTLIFVKCMFRAVVLWCWKNCHTTGSWEELLLKSSWMQEVLEKSIPKAQLTSFPSIIWMTQCHKDHFFVCLSYLNVLGCLSRNSCVRPKHSCWLIAW